MSQVRTNPPPKKQKKTHDPVRLAEELEAANTPRSSRQRPMVSRFESTPVRSSTGDELPRQEPPPGPSRCIRIYSWFSEKSNFAWLIENAKVHKPSNPREFYYDNTQNVDGPKVDYVELNRIDGADEDEVEDPEIEKEAEESDEAVQLAESTEFRNSFGENQDDIICIE